MTDEIVPQHPLADGRPEELSDPSSVRVDASRAAIAQKIKRLPPGEHSVELRAKAVPSQMALRIAAFSSDLGAGMVQDLDKIFGPAPEVTAKKEYRAYVGQGEFWFSVLDACGIADADLQGLTLEELATKISGKRVVAVVSNAGYLNRVRPV